MVCVVVLQNSMDFVEGGTGSGTETCVTFDVDVTEEPVRVKDEIPERISFPPIKTEPEVRFQGVCEVVAVHACWPFVAATKKFSNYT
jgi:hypothetical protein